MSRVCFDDLTPEQQREAMSIYREQTRDTDPDHVVLNAVFYGIDWDSETGKPWGGVWRKLYCYICARLDEGPAQEAVLCCNELNQPVCARHANGCVQDGHGTRPLDQGGPYRWYMEK